MSFPETSSAYIHLVGSEYDGTIIDSQTIQGTGPADKQGIRLENCKDVQITNCDIDDVTDGIFIRGADNTIIRSNTINDCTIGIRLSIAAGSDNVKIQLNDIKDITGDGISSPQRDEDAVNQHEIEISSNRLRDVATTVGAGLSHGIYCQSQDYLIRNNLILRVGDGNGISVRSSGRIYNNIIKTTGQSSIRYFADHKTGRSRRIEILRNTCLDAANNTAANLIQFLNIPAEHLSKDDWAILDAIIEWNNLGDETDVDYNEDTFTIFSSNNYRVFSEL